jgi:Flp pilus assembly protein TadG
MAQRALSLAPRVGVAAMELVVVLPLLLILLFGIWDVARTVEVQQLVNNAAREGARKAAVGMMLDQTTGAEHDIYATDVQQTVVNYLTQNGLNTTGISVQFADLDNPGATDPYLASQLDRLQVTVQLPFNNVRFVLVNNFNNINTTVLTGVSNWRSLKDANVVVPTTLPTN